MTVEEVIQDQQVIKQEDVLAYLDLQTNSSE